MITFINLPFPKSIFDIIDTNPEDIEGLSEKEYAILEKEYINKLDAQYLIEAHIWANKYIKVEYIIIWAQNAGDEYIEFEIQLD